MLVNSLRGAEIFVDRGLLIENSRLGGRRVEAKAFQLVEACV